MQNNKLFVSLNAHQLKAVSFMQQHLLVLAGAGSGKTRVLVHRIAWLVETKQCSLDQILAVTFTNKAAQELRGRLENLIGKSTKSMWVGTFHGLTHRMLRLHYQRANLPQTFQILDADDQQRLLKRIITTQLNLDETQWPPKKIQWFINKQKDEGIRAQFVETPDAYTKTWVEIYRVYEQTCIQNGVLDFAELILRCYELLQQHPDLLQHYRARFRYVLVDEFQDTNSIQYAWLRLIAHQEGSITMVGDDDQAIYGWRGAKIENIHRFTQDFPRSETIRLEQNYRSSAAILNAANALIDHNKKRLGKNLWTEGEQGDLISVYAAFNDQDEARFIVGQIQAWLKKEIKLQQIALLYRSNAQSRLLEEALIHAQIPYRIYGGLRFYERAEIKDVLAYLRLISHRHDDSALERVINFPTRGIGEKTLESLRHDARSEGKSLWQAAQHLINTEVLTSRATLALKNFLDLIDRLTEQTKELDLAEQTEYVIHHSGLFAYYQKEKGEQGLAKRENLGELISATRLFVPLESSNNKLSDFLSAVALDSGEYQEHQAQEAVQLMTLHAAKGLEFPVVFLCGMEEGLFPHQMSLETPGRLEEERRLCYVGITRAMQKLYLTHAQIRRLHGKEVYHRPSRFLAELPETVLDEIRVKTIIKPKIKPTVEEKTEQSGLYPGQSVMHPHFGRGFVLAIEGHGEHTRVQIDFERHGVKWLILRYARLESTID
jgi:DNA helicase II / ATP-dependent DNA helicase PcrA